MPIYGFECDACGHRFDRLQRLSDPDPTTCPDCGAQALKRQLTAPSFRLSGSGWYETDFKKDGDRKRNLADKGDGAAPAEKSEAKPSLESGTAAGGAKSSTTGESAAAKPATPAEAKPGAKPEAKPQPKPPSTPALP